MTIHRTFDNKILEQQVKPGDLLLRGSKFLMLVLNKRVIEEEIEITWLQPNMKIYKMSYPY